MTSNIKTYLHFNPLQIKTHSAFITIQQLNKLHDELELNNLPLNKENLKEWFSYLDNNAFKALQACFISDIKTKKAEIIKKAEAIKNIEERENTINRILDQHFYKLVEKIRRLPIKNWQHTTTINNRIKNINLTFYAFPIDLVFQISKKEALFNLNIHVKIGQQVISFLTFKQYNFLLEKDNQYYQITYNYYKALNWIHLNYNTLNFSKEEAYFIVNKLESMDVKIEYTALVESIHIVTIPKFTLLLSELNDSFLKLEPQYNYDGYIVECNFEPTTTIKEPDKFIHIQRNKVKESEFDSYLRSLHDRFKNQNNGFFYLPFADAQKKNWFLKTYQLLLDQDIDLIGVDMLKKFRYSPFSADTKLKQLNEDKQHLTIELNVKFGKESVPLLFLQKALFNNQKAVLLKDGSLGVLDEDWQSKYGLLLRHSKVLKNEISVPKWLMLGDITAQETSVEAAISKSLTPTWFNKWEQWEQQQTSLYPLPIGLQVEQLRPYQKIGFEWLCLLSEIGAGACLADDMGLGKTLQTICFLLTQLEAEPHFKHLVIAPTSLLYNWEKEFEKFAPTARVYIFHGQERSREYLKDDKYDIIITSYGTVRQEIEILVSIVWNTIVLDESHNIKNPAALTTKAILQLSSKSKIALSGTPLMNSTMDLHSQMHFLVPNLLGTHEFFKKEYALPIEQSGNEEKAAVLKKLTKPFILRRTKTQVAKDLPDRTETTLWCEMETAQRNTYEQVKESIRSNIFTEIKAEGLNKGKLAILAGLTKLRQICNSGELVKEESLFTNDSVKTKILISELQNIIPKHKALVFSQFTSMLDLLERDLNKAGIPTLRIDGKTPSKKRQELVHQFQSKDDKTPVFLISLKAGNTGLTLTSADYVFLFDPWWNVAVENQAIDRTHRIGQLQNVFAYRLVCRNSIEEKILHLASKKKTLAEDLITTDENLIKGLTIEDLHFLLS